MDELSLQEVDNGVLVPIRVIPRARRTTIDGMHDGALRVRLNAPPVDGAANRALIDYLAGILACRKRDLELIRGARSRDKVVRVDGMSITAVRSMLRQSMQ